MYIFCAVYLIVNLDSDEDGKYKQKRFIIPQKENGVFCTCSTQHMLYIYAKYPSILAVQIGAKSILVHVNVHAFFCSCECLSGA